MTKLFFDVLVIKQQVRSDKLIRYIDDNHRLVIIVTRSFLSDSNAVEAVSTIANTCKEYPKEAVLLLLLDAMPSESF